MATHSSILAWRIPQTEELRGLQSMGLQKDTTEHAHAHTHTHTHTPRPPPPPQNNSNGGAVMPQW